MVLRSTCLINIFGKKVLIEIKNHYKSFFYLNLTSAQQHFLYFLFKHNNYNSKVITLKTSRLINVINF